MAISISSGFTVKGKSPIDTRFVMTKAQMVAANPSLMPDKYFTVCSDDGKLYLYDKSIETPSEETGKFKVLEVSLQAGEDGQILMYKDTDQDWKPVDLADNRSLIYSDYYGLQLKGFTSAAQPGQMPVKDENAGLRWITPLNQSALDAAVQNANEAATRSANSATESGSSASSAAQSAQQATAINQATQRYVEDKFWWGSQEEYNALEQINEGTFYFVQR